MRFLIGLVFFGGVLTLNAQYDFDNLSPYEKEIMDFINTDRELSIVLEEGRSKMRKAKIKGHTSQVILGISFVGFLVGVSAKEPNTRFASGILTGVIGLVLGCAIGTSALITNRKGKKQIDRAINYARGALENNNQGSINLNATNNGVGIVYSF